MQQTVTIKDVYTVSDREGDQKSRWTKIGIGFVNRDDSINVILDAYPVNGKLQIRTRENKKPERT
ncbi:MAG: hypothetical protein HYW02_00235 [Deltaproteobacteria bacterium]|nr:hypothetical protein [Deltaproteobacteria bacterium]